MILQGPFEKQQHIHYEFDTLEQPLGEGGMGKVYRGMQVHEDTGAKREVAVKFMYSDLPAHAIERARREAAICLQHENLVEMLGFIETKERDGLGGVMHHYHVVSELLIGVALDDLLSGKLTDQDGNRVAFAEKLYAEYQKDPYRFALFIVKNILSGLIMLHDKGYVHRDIDPTNIMLTADGKVKLIDFGIAKQMSSLTSNDKSLTVAGVFMGKPEYAAPELVLGDIHAQGKPTDIYAMGMLLYQCITGHVPFEGDKSDVLNQQLHKKVPLSLIKRKDVRTVIAKATDKQRQNRYQSAAEMRVAIDRISTVPTSSTPNWKTWAGVAAAAVVIVVGVTLWPKFSQKDSLTSEPSPNKEQTADFGTAFSMLGQAETAEQGLALLEQLSQQNNGQATMLLSRLYFQSQSADDPLPHSVQTIQDNLLQAGLIVPNNTKAHTLLEKAVEQAPQNYEALYQLGLDYYRGSARAAEYERDLNKALALFTQAQSLIQARLDTLSSGPDQRIAEQDLSNVTASLAKTQSMIEREKLINH